MMASTEEPPSYALLLPEEAALSEKATTLELTRNSRIRGAIGFAVPGRGIVAVGKITGVDRAERDGAAGEAVWRWNFVDVQILPGPVDHQPPNGVLVWSRLLPATRQAIATALARRSTDDRPPTLPVVAEAEAGEEATSLPGPEASRQSPAAPVDAKGSDTDPGGAAVPIMVTALGEAGDDPGLASSGVDGQVPFAADGSWFGPHLADSRGGFRIGAKGEEETVSGFQPALDRLGRMAKARWRRPNARGHWGIVTAVSWGALPAAAFHRPAGSPADDGWVPLNVRKCFAAEAVLREDRTRRVPIPSVLWFEADATTTASPRHQIDPGRPASCMGVMPNRDLLLRSGSPYPWPIDGTVATMPKWEPWIAIGVAAWEALTTAGDLIFPDDAPDILAAALKLSPALRDDPQLSKYGRTAVLDALRDCQLFGLCDAWRKGRSWRFTATDWAVDQAQESAATPLS